MTTVDSTICHRQDSFHIVATHRRATVGAPPPASYSFSNTFESHRPSSRADKLSSASPYPYLSRRSTLPGHEGHNVNDAPPLAPHDTVMWSDSAPPSPNMSSATRASWDSPRHAHSTFEYDPSPFPNPLHSPLTSSFSLCSSPDRPTNLGAHPRSMPTSLFHLPSGTSSMRSFISTSGATTTTTPSLSPAASSTSFVLDPALDLTLPSSRPSDLASMSRQELEVELAYLRSLHSYRPRLTELESQDNKVRLQNELGIFAQEAPSGFPTVSDEQWMPPRDWKARTEARIKQFCSLNRAGNALCGWHNPRRERREYSPRMAPPETLNCGCTYAEALFEESLARHGVGSYFPGDSVRMDPALRNPLLKLLEKRYGYRDGDFERLPDGEWREGEDALKWEEQANTRAGVKRER